MTLRRSHASGAIIFRTITFKNPVLKTFRRRDCGAVTFRTSKKYVSYKNKTLLE